MKNLSFLIIGALFFASYGCGSSSSDPAPVVEDPAPASPNAKVTYDGNVKALLTGSCAPCHLSGGDNDIKFDQYATAKSKISDILDRVQRESSADGFMPKNAAKLSSAQIDLLKKWQADGLDEK